MSNIKSYITAVLLLLTVPAIAQQTVSLDSILQLIQARNPQLEQYNRRVEAMDAYTEGATAWMAPMVGVGTFMTPYPGQEVMNSANGGSFMLSLEQQIPNPARQRANKAWYGSRAAVEEARQEAVYNELRAEAKAAYYAWLVLERKKEVLQESERIMKTMQKLAEIRYPYAQGSLGAIYKAEGRLYEVQNMLLMTEGEIEEKNIRLNTLMDLPRGTRFQIDTSQVRPVALTVVQDTAELAQRRSDIEAMNRNIRSMRLNQELMQTGSRPDFRIRFDHMSSYSGMMPHQFTLMAMVSIPIAPWSSNMYRSEVRGMGYEIEAMQKEREAMLNQMLGMLKRMQTELRSMQQQLRNYDERIIPALRKNYQTTMLAYEENREQLPMVIDAWEALNMAQMNQLDVLRSYYQMVVEYEKVIESE